MLALIEKNKKMKNEMKKRIGHCVGRIDSLNKKDHFRLKKKKELPN
jgi:hypothetical protein